MNKAELHQRTTEKRLFREKLLTMFVAIIVAAMVGTLVLLVWQKGSQRVDTSDFDGRIIDRWADYTESEYGSEARFRLSVEADDGKHFTVKVGPSMYESAKVGMRVQRRAGQIVLIETAGKSSGK